MAKLDAVGVIVSDLKRAVAFYRLLGAPFAEDAGISEHGHAEATLDGGIRLMLDTEESIKSFNPEWRRASGSPGASLAFRCESPHEVDEMFERAVANGARVHMKPWDAFWGQRYALLFDPDGNAFDLYADVREAES